MKSASLGFLLSVICYLHVVVAFRHSVKSMWRPTVTPSSPSIDKQNIFPQKISSSQLWGMRSRSKEDMLRDEFRGRDLIPQKHDPAASYASQQEQIAYEKEREKLWSSGSYDFYDDGDEDDESMDDYDETEDGEMMEGMMNFKKNLKNDQEWMFFDVAKINVKGGEGGDGCMAMRREFRIEFGGPSGGNGGHGGSVYLEVDENLNTLSILRRKVHHRAKDGTNGRGDSRHGSKGADCIIPVPPGTIVRDQFGVLAGELNKHGQRLLVARGGKGGRGNEHFKTPRMNAPEFAEKGEKGAERWLNIELKLIADVGFIGVPNAGKSTLLAASSNAKPKIADYPFTTIVPNLGVCDIDGNESGKGLVLADIPGLLEGAHSGVGLGLSFLRHVQRCR